MTDQEIVRALRCCKFGAPCEKCPVVGNEDCFDEVNTAAADLIERLTAENAALREKVPQWISVEADRLRELAEADKDGRVLVMPCKFGDKLYRVFGEEIQEFTVSNIKYMGLQHRWSVDTTPFILYAENLIGTELFLAREEAERALQEMEGKKDGKT